MTACMGLTATEGGREPYCYHTVGESEHDTVRVRCHRAVSPFPATKTDHAGLPTTEQSTTSRVRDWWATAHVEQYDV